MSGRRDRVMYRMYRLVEARFASARHQRSSTCTNIQLNIHKLERREAAVVRTVSLESGDTTTADIVSSEGREPPHAVLVWSLAIHFAASPNSLMEPCPTSRRTVTSQLVCAPRPLRGPCPRQLDSLLAVHNPTRTFCRSVARAERASLPSYFSFDLVRPMVPIRRENTILYRERSLPVPGVVIWALEIGCCHVEPKWRRFRLSASAHRDGKDWLH